MIEKMCRERIAKIRLAVFRKLIPLPKAQREVKALTALIVAAQADAVNKSTNGV